MGEKRIVIIGAGGHAKVVAASWLDGGGRIDAILDDNPSLQGQLLLGHEISLQPRGRDILKEIPAILAIGDNETRRRLSGSLNPHSWQTVIHPGAYVHESAKIGAGALICAGAIVQPDVRIGDHVIVNSGAVIEHDCEVGDFAHIGPTACLGGSVIAGEGVFVGLGAKVMPLRQLGNWSIVGAGATVVRNVGSGLTVAGVPARPLSR